MLFFIVCSIICGSSASDVASKRQIDRAKKLLRLTTSPNQHEAARAREQAIAYMAAHGINEADVIEAVLEVVDDHSDASRVWLAQFAARFFGVAVVGHKRQGLGFRGPPSRVQKAKTLYCGAIDELTTAELPPIGVGYQVQCRVVFDYFWWEGFAQVLCERFPAPPRPPAEAPPEIAVELPPEMRVVSEPAPIVFEDPKIPVQKVVQDIGRNVAMEWVGKHGREAGQAAARRVTIVGDYFIALPASSN